MEKINGILNLIEMRKKSLSEAFRALQVESKGYENHLEFAHKCFQESYEELKSRDDHLREVQELLEKRFEQLEQEEDEFRLKEEKLGLMRKDVKLREERMDEREKLMKELFGEMKDGFENVRNMVDEGVMEKLDAMEVELTEKDHGFITELHPTTDYEMANASTESAVHISSAYESDGSKGRRNKRLPSRGNASCNDEAKREAFGNVESEICGTDFHAAADNTMQNKHAGNLPGGISKMDKCEQTDGAVKVEIINDSESDDDTKTLFCPDPEFNDFNKDQHQQTSFTVGQIWALYDTLHGMPRFYAIIRKVFKTGFKLRITWLEPNPENQAEVDWVKQELPFGCGRFKRGNTADTSDSLTFSHQMECGKGKGRGSLLVYPRKGEIWALFHEWDIEWSLDPEADRKYRYEVFEVVSDFVEKTGIRVVYLHKVRGFVSLFHRTSLSETNSLLIPPSELLRFSHRIPSFKMTGAEKEGVPIGSYELDPAALPTYPGGIFRRKDGYGNLGAGTGVSCAEVI